MANNDNNNNGHQQQGQPFPLPAIHDIDGWLRFNGLRSADEEPPEAPAYGSFMSELNRSEAKQKQEEAQRYQQKLHEKFFKEQLDVEKEQQEANRRLLEKWEDEVMEIHTSSKAFRVPLAKIAAECDTVFTLASSRRYMKNILNHNCETEEEEKDGEEDVEMVTLSLVEYAEDAVREFINLVLGQKRISDIEGHYVVDCCQIGHYLQCARILHGTVQILLQNIDNANCLALCQMADQLELPDLFERALFHMMKSMDRLENHEAYEDFSPELKNRITAIRQVFTRAENDKSEKKSLYFTSIQEYIAIFAENVQYHRERLEQAKEQNKDRFSAYQQSKIEKQELRVLTLEAMLQEHKRLFASDYKKNTIQKKRSLDQKYA